MQQLSFLFALYPRNSCSFIVTSNPTWNLAGNGHKNELFTTTTSTTTDWLGSVAIGAHGGAVVGILYWIVPYKAEYVPRNKGNGALSEIIMTTIKISYLPPAWGSPGNRSRAVGMWDCKSDMGI